MSKKNLEIEYTPHFRKNISNDNILNDNNKILEKFPENYKNCRFILLDTETTGLDLSVDRLISINAVEMINCELTGIQFNAYLNRRFKDKTKPIMYYLSEYNYSRNNNLKKSLETFLEFVSDSIIITHNALFDMKFINSELKRCGLREIPYDQCVCTLKFLKNLKKIGRLDKNFKLRLRDLCEYYQIEVNEKDLHQGIIDVILFGRVVSKMLENGIYNDYDSYDFKDANSIINCTNVDINYHIESSNDELSGELNEEETENEDEKEIKKNNILPSKSEEIKSKVNININSSFDKNLKKNIKGLKGIKINYFRNNKNKNNEKWNYLDINNINCKSNKKYKNNKKKLSKSYIGFKKTDNSMQYNKKFSEPINEFYKRKNNNFNKEEPKINFIKNAFKSYIKDNQQNIQIKELKI